MKMIPRGIHDVSISTTTTITTIRTIDDRWGTGIDDDDDDDDDDDADADDATTNYIYS